MLYRKPVSIVLALLLFACAISFIVFSIVGVVNTFKDLGSDPDIQPIIQSLSAELPGDGPNVFMTVLLWGMLLWRYGAAVLLAVMCIVLAILLLVRSGRKVHPMPLAIWGGGVLFFSLITAVFCYLKFFPDAADVGYTGAWPFTIFNLSGPSLLGPAITAMVSFIVGVFVCIFASALYRHIRSGTLAPLPEPAPRFVPATAPPQPSPQVTSAEESLKKLLLLKESGLVTAEEYEVKRSEIIRRM